MEDSKPSYYGIVPANVRYCKTIPDGAKLLYSEITALCNQKGYCFASNSYFSELYGKSTITISRWFSALAKHGFITVDIDSKDNHTRKVYLNHTLIKNDKAPLSKMIKPLIKNDKHNSTLNSKENNNTVHSSQNALFADDSKYSFNSLWDKYNHKRGKQQALKAYKKLSKKDIIAAVDKIDEYDAFLQVAKISKLHLSTYLNNRRWEDDMEVNAPQSSNTSQSTKGQQSVKDIVASNSIKNHPRFKELYIKVQDISHASIKHDSAKITALCFRFLDKFGVGVDEAVDRFDELLNNQKS